MIVTGLKQGRIAPRGAAVLLLFAVACGCEKEPVASPQKMPAAVTARTQDAEYKKSLQDVQKRRRKLAARRGHVAAQMEALVARARAALPAGATDEQVRHELQDHPEKYPGWRELSLSMQDLTQKAEQELTDARTLVRTRILKELAEQEQGDLTERR